MDKTNDIYRKKRNI